jgi:hypothetical protein
MTVNFAGHLYDDAGNAVSCLKQIPPLRKAQLLPRTAMVHGRLPRGIRIGMMLR